METAQHWDRLAKNQPAEITMFQISEVQEAPAFNGRLSILTLRGTLCWGSTRSHLLRSVVGTIGSSRLLDLTPVTGASVYERIQTGRSPERIFQMPKKRYEVDQIIPMLRRADVELGKGRKVPEVCKMLGIVQQTYYRWRQKYGGMAPEMAKELKSLQKENAQLKTLVANQALDNAILKEAAKGNF